MRVEYSKRAVSDIRLIAAYDDRAGNPAVAERIVARIQEVVAQFTGSPLIGCSVVQRPGVRAVLLSNYRYKSSIGWPGTRSGSYTSATLRGSHITEIRMAAVLKSPHRAHLEENCD